MIAGVLLDLSGVIYVGDKPLAGAIEAVGRLREARLPLRFLTNTTRTPKGGILRNLHDMGLACSDHEVFTPAQAACDWLMSHDLSPHLLIHPNLAEDFQGLSTEPSDGRGAAVVIGDAGEGFTYRSLNATFRRLVDGAEFLALAANRSFKDADGELSLDAGAFVAALEYAAQKHALVLGKPAPAFFEAALAGMGCRAEQTVMVGDDAEADVSGALAAGIGYGLLVRTGKYIAGAEQGLDQPPTAILDDLPAAVDWILDRRMLAVKDARPPDASSR